MAGSSRGRGSLGAMWQIRGWYPGCRVRGVRELQRWRFPRPETFQTSVSLLVGSVMEGGRGTGKGRSGQVRVEQPQGNLKQAEVAQLRWWEGWCNLQRRKVVTLIKNCVGRKDGTTWQLEAYKSPGGVVVVKMEEVRQCLGNTEVHLKNNPMQDR